MLTRGIYFDKLMMVEIVKFEFNPGAATAYFATAEKGILILIVQPHWGNEKTDIQSKEQAMQFTK
jgi:hypothetical protein